MDVIGFHKHDHQGCITDSLETARSICSDEGLQFTPVRQRVYRLLLEGHRAMGAYEILDVLKEEGLGSQPPVAYRALDFLMKHRFVHKIERLNAFVACTHPGEHHAPVFLICRLCSGVAEACRPDALSILGAEVETTGFSVERAVIEVEGLCPACAGDQRQ
ncbi:transcriptional repressor [Qingshengfaniella alkalisoli]|uniref:Transcriptional repressor n=1 Tax=Qingshengfaniella alkalisoli TaxID=2599296 RepID=A0A5B8I7U6_9RHOB|nr:transcriptional repressor [Qingshengfaniella alkalisoli]QDY69699.1 transcriptional repressor [Qingshengfaniella alkalisoli]